MNRLASPPKPSAAVVKASNHFAVMVSNVPGDPIVAKDVVGFIVVPMPLWRAP
jgi:hypothetical protein